MPSSQILCLFYPRTPCHSHSKPPLITITTLLPIPLKTMTLLLSLLLTLIPPLIIILLPTTTTLPTLILAIPLMRFNCLSPFQSDLR